MPQSPPNPASRRPTRQLAPLFGLVLRPIQQFFRLEAASGVLLLGCAALAVVLANSPAAEHFRAVLEYPLVLGAGPGASRFSVRELVNDALMSVFFLVVGMEIKRELVVGELRTVGRATLPAIAALGGMAVPAAIYFALNRGQEGQAGWGIPMATDIAFCIGCLTLLKKRVPHALIVFVTALAIFDDIGGILVIAFFYGTGLHLSWLLAAAAVTLALYAMNRAYVRSGVAWGIAGAFLWYALHHGGIHATIAGVVLGLMIPARVRRPSGEVLRELADHTRALVDRNRAEDEELQAAEILTIEERLEDLEAPVNRFVHLLHPYVAFGIMPVFALANSGVSLGGMGLAELTAPVAMGSALGLFVGKQIGIFSCTALAVRLGVAPMPGGVSHTKLYGVSVVAGIGFTVAIFIATLAFRETPVLLDESKVGILLGSLAAGLVGCGVLRLTRITHVSADR